MRQAGFTYVGVLVLVAIGSATLAGAGALWTIESRREKEAQLLFVGQQFNRAIASFRDKTPGGQRQRFPTRLEELLDDKRWPTTRRHLRQVYVDPMTGTREWGLVKGPGGEIMGVYSLGAGVPLKQAGFPKNLESFERSTSYEGWRFVYTSPGDAPATN